MQQKCSCLIPLSGNAKTIAMNSTSSYIMFIQPILTFICKISSSNAINILRSSYSTEIVHICAVGFIPYRLGKHTIYILCYLVNNRSFFQFLETIPLNLSTLSIKNLIRVKDTTLKFMSFFLSTWNELHNLNLGS